MHSRHPELTEALSKLLEKMNHSLTIGGYQGEPVQMYLAGGMAVHYYCGTRYTADVDASFSHRLALQFDELVVDYVREDGSPASIYLDPNYTDALALLHPDHREDSVVWADVGSEVDRIDLRVFSPVDLAVSKLSRFSPVDEADIEALAERHLFTAEELRSRADEAMSYYVGDLTWIRHRLSSVCDSLSHLPSGNPQL